MGAEGLASIPVGSGGRKPQHMPDHLRLRPATLAAGATKPPTTASIAWSLRAGTRRWWPWSSNSTWA